MTKYDEIFKCKLCGRLFQNGTHDSKDEIKYVNLRVVHNCDNGDVGACDFLGLKRREETDFQKDVFTWF